MTTLILLAAGRGSRLDYMTDDIPKCLNTYRDKPLLQHIIEKSYNLRGEFSEIVIVGGYKWEKLRKYDHTLLVNSSWSTSGPFKSLETADVYLSEGDCVVSYTDVYFSKNFLQSCLDSSAHLFVPSNFNYMESWRNRQIEVISDLESFKQENNYLTEIGKKVRDIEEVQGQFAGLIKISPVGWSRIKSCLETIDKTRLDMTSMLQIVIENQHKVITDQIVGFWKEFDEVSDFHCS